MSKQLIHAFKSHVVITALGNQAFAIITDEKDTNSVAHIVELSPPVVNSPAQPSKKKSKPNEEADDEKIAKPSTSPDDTKGEIQAVCCTVVQSHIWLAVSSEDKTLSLYSVPESIASADKQDAVRCLQPLAVYNMPKRARCLVFSTVQSNGDCNIIIAGDLSGDSYAYPVPVGDSCDKATAATAKDSTRRLLLGHTASILTGMQITPSSSGGKKFILTADRDEKVRVSCFPETYNIHGYLLGHTAFISAMDAVSGGSNSPRSLCVTGSGDGTVRLWDYQTCKEVGMVPVVLQPFCNDGDVESKENDYAELKDEKGFYREVNEDESVEFDGRDDYSDDEEYDGLIAVPNSVAMSSNYIAVARDGILSIDIHPIPTPAKQSSSASSLFLSQLISLHNKQTLLCPSQPLDVCILSDGSVLVLAREPEFMLHFKCVDTSLEFEDVTSTSPLCSALAHCAILRNITMPMTALEYNEDGTLKLQKKADNREFDNEGDEIEVGAANKTGKSGQHWNDKERRSTHRLANGRRRKRKLNKCEKNDD